jgi:hypothetical protein
MTLCGSSNREQAMTLGVYILTENRRQHLTLCVDLLIVVCSLLEDPHSVIVVCSLLEDQRTVSNVVVCSLLEHPHTVSLSSVFC